MKFLEEREEAARGSAEEAETKEHQVTYLPKSPHCEVCATAKVQRKQARTPFTVIELDTVPWKSPVEFGVQVTADHLTKMTTEKRILTSMSTHLP